MTELPIIAFVPCRKGSQRIIQKNTRPFADEPDGLIGHKLRQLSGCGEHAKIVVSTDDAEVMDIANRHAEQSTIPIEVHDRPPELAIADTLDAFVAHIPDIIPAGVLAWTHVTSPFFGTEAMDAAARAYRENVENGPFDSLMAVESVRTFVWDDTGCISHDRGEAKWPQTQDLRPFYLVNSALFMCDIELMKRLRDRIGNQPFLYDVDSIAGFDIDWPRDFELAETLHRAMAR